MPTLLGSGGAEVLPGQSSLLSIFCFALDSFFGRATFSEGDAGRVSEVESSGGADFSAKTRALSAFSRLQLFAPMQLSCQRDRLLRSPE